MTWLLTIAIGLYIRFDDDIKVKYPYSHNQSPLKTWANRLRIAHVVHETYMKNGLNLRHTPDTIYLKSVPEIQYLPIRPSNHNVLNDLYASEDCTIVRKHIPAFPGIYMKPTANNGTTTSGTLPRKKYVNNGKGWYFRFDIDDNKTRAILDISSRSLKLEWASLIYTTPHTAKKIRKVNKRASYIFCLGMDNIYILGFIGYY